ncbi:glycogen debranching enzyme [Nocardioides sp. J9]|uniref:amylo-alpha-1,6-glucosidase n=1 Tax=Nocardioides sp. J9 TaxID=935844 RepID=UPI0011A55507|nr:glycogen debranching N-terminal domain-containing protein [Nocardioides sp. J9]TWG91517.1 glycogen debranching enzyme [Nocardioides sp. J9]
METAARPTPDTATTTDRADRHDRDGEVAASSAVVARGRDVTLVEGSSFCVSDHAGAIDPGGAHGLFVRDTRVLSRWQLYVDRHPVEPLTVISEEPFSCRFLGRCTPRPGQADATLVSEVRRFVGQGMREDITLHNHGPEAAGVEVLLQVEADFADLFEVKDRRPGGRRGVGRRAVGTDLVCWVENTPEQRGVRISAPGAQITAEGISFRAVVPPHGRWTTTVEVLPSVSGQELAAAFPTDRPLESAAPARRMQGWTAAAPTIEVGHAGLAAALAMSRRDLGALRIVDADHPGDDVVAAGAPWFMALFGRDSLLTSAMLLPYMPELALGTLRTLARLQGRREDAMTEEQPGKILHEVRLGADLSLALGGDSVYYGSIDSTPLFAVLVGSALRWGVPVEQLRELVPAVDRGLRWVDTYGDRDGDGFVEYQRSTDRGLVNQGWKDSFDAIAFPDGRAARPPIALAEVQGYVYAALLARADLADALGADGAPWRDRAAALRQRFHDAFWLPDRGFHAMALDGDKRPVEVLSSNIGHCLWTGIVEESVAGQMIDHLLSPEMFTGFGIRTLGTEAASYNPVSYHDTVLAAAGIARYGYREQAERVLSGLLDAVGAFGGRLPELFCGFDRTELPVPVPYPTSCSPQAWAAGVPYELLRIAVGLDADVPRGRLSAEPAMGLVGSVRIDGLRLGNRTVSVHADAAQSRLTGWTQG